MGKFIEIHAIQSLGPACINRDDAGLPKTVIYGGVERARVSSQCWKRATRLKAHELGLDNGSIRTRTLPRLIADGIRSHNPDMDDQTALMKAVDIVQNGMKLAVETETKKKKKEDQPAGDPYNKTALLIGRDTLDRIIEESAKPEPDLTEIHRLLQSDTSRDVACFGRMSADDRTCTVDGAVQVAHAIGVTPADIHFDYYGAVDDNPNATGTAMLGTIPFDAPVLYRYACIDHAMLETRLGRKAADETVRTFVEAFLTSLPTGRQHGFAANTIPDFAMVDLSRRPLSRVNAFLTPVQSDPVNTAISLLDANETKANDWGMTPIRRWLIGCPDTATTLTASGIWPTGTFDDLLDGLTDALNGETPWLS